MADTFLAEGERRCPYRFNTHQLDYVALTAQESAAYWVNKRRTASPHAPSATIAVQDLSFLSPQMPSTSFRPPFSSNVRPLGTIKSFPIARSASLSIFPAPVPTPASAIHTNSNAQVLPSLPDLPSYLPVEMPEVSQDHALSLSSSVCRTAERQEVYSTPLSSAVRRVLANDTAQDSVECIFPQLFWEPTADDTDVSAPPLSTSPSTRQVSAASESSGQRECSRCHESQTQILEALSNMKKTQILMLDELSRLNRNVSNNTSHLACLRGQVRQSERQLDRIQKLRRPVGGPRNCRRNNQVNRPTRPKKNLQLKMQSMSSRRTIIRFSFRNV